MDIDLDTLKQEILSFLDASNFAVFRSYPGGLEGMSLICWDCERFPDYRMFLEAAEKLHVQLILVATREFEQSEIDEEVEELDSSDIQRDERRAFDTKLAKYKKYTSQTCSLELAFDHNARMYVYEIHPDWYDEFVELSEEIAEAVDMGDSGDDEEEGGMGGFYSNN